MSYAQRSYPQLQGINGRYKKPTVGDVFGYLTIVSYSHSDKQNHFWNCICICKNTVTIRTRSLKSGKTVSCGCYQHSLVTKHGMASSDVAAIWRNMKYRCTNENAANYKIYGGRGIKVCAEWMHSFEAFYTDMGERPDKTYSLERRDNNLGYSPGNCYWATKKEQGRNRRTNRMLTYRGTTKPLVDFCEEFGLLHHQLSSRLNAGWSVEKALLTPVRLRTK